MQIKILLFTFFMLLAVVTNTAMSDPVVDSAPSEKVVSPAKEKTTEEANKSDEPAIRYTPTEKLRADDTVKFPVDI